MSTTIVVNTASGAVTEYDWTFESLTPTHAGTADGLYTLGGDTDAAAPIAATLKTGKSLLGSQAKKALDTVFFAMVGDADSTGTLLVEGEGTAYSYAFAVRAKGLSRAQPGKGIRENYLLLGFSNVAGADFRIDQIDAPTPKSVTRRT
jgi:hypothetical protein